jgi:hypothetical protein
MKRFKEESDDEEKESFTNPNTENNVKFTNNNFSSFKADFNEEKPKFSIKEKELIEPDHRNESQPKLIEIIEDKPAENNFNKNNNSNNFTNEAFAQPYNVAIDVSRKEDIYNKNSFFSKR